MPNINDKQATYKSHQMGRMKQKFLGYYGKRDANSEARSIMDSKFTMPCYWPPS